MVLVVLAIIPLNRKRYQLKVWTDCEIELDPNHLSEGSLWELKRVEKSRSS